MLGIQIQQFEAINAEIRNGMHCCCDKEICGNDTNPLNLSECTDKCDPYFVLHFQTCSSNGSCYDAKIINLPVNDSALIFIQIPFNQSELKSNQVRLHILCIHCYITVNKLYKELSGIYTC